MSRHRREWRIAWLVPFASARLRAVRVCLLTVTCYAVPNGDRSRRGIRVPVSLVTRGASEPRRHFSHVTFQRLTTAPDRTDRPWIPAQRGPTRRNICALHVARHALAMPHFELFTRHGDFLEHLFNATPEQAKARAEKIGASIVHRQGDEPPVFEPRPEPVDEDGPESEPPAGS